MNQTAHDKAAAINDQLESPVGKLMWTAAKTLITLFITAAVTVSTSYLSNISKKQDDQTNINIRQDLALQAINQLQQSQQKVQDSQGLTIQQMSQQVLHNTDSIDQLKDIQVQIVQRGRPR